MYILSALFSPRLIRFRSVAFENETHAVQCILIEILDKIKCFEKMSSIAKLLNVVCIVILLFHRSNCSQMNKTKPNIIIILADDMVTRRLCE